MHTVLGAGTEIFSWVSDECLLDSRIALTAALSLLPNFYLIIPYKVKQLPVSEYPEAWQLIVQAFLQMEWEFKVPNGWKRNELLAPSLSVPVVLLGECGFHSAQRCLDLPLAQQQCCTDAGPKGLLPITPELCPAQGTTWGMTTVWWINSGKLWREHVCGETALCARRCGGNPAGRDGWCAS